MSERKIAKKREKKSKKVIESETIKDSESSEERIIEALEPITSGDREQARYEKGSRSLKEEERRKASKASDSTVWKGLDGFSGEGAVKDDGRKRKDNRGEIVHAREKIRALKLRKRRLKLLFFVFGTSFVAAITFLTLWPKFRFNDFVQEKTVGFREEFDYKNGEVCYGNILRCEEVEVGVIGEVDTDTLGEYKLVYRVTHGPTVAEREVTVRVIDNLAPVLLLTEFDEVDEEISENGQFERKISVCPNGKIPKIKMKANDNYDGDLSEKIEMSFDGGETVTISVEDSSQNRTEEKVKGVVEDLAAPVITLSGNESKTIVVGGVYEEAGATAIDNCDDNLEITTDGTVDVMTAGIYEIRYIAKDAVGNKGEATRTVRIVDPSNGNRVVYLTFDDGPSEHTDRLLDVLAKYGVKATFFVTGSGSDATIEREYNEGHTVALHTSSHNYAYIYASIDNYFADLYAIRDRVQRITGYAPTLIRFPGGSSNTVSTLYDGGIRIMSYLTSEVGRRGFNYADWNVSSGDAGGATTSDQVFNNVVYRLGEGTYVVLQHDTKGFSVDAVERIIQYGQANGYTFLPMTASSFMAHHGVNN